MKAAIIGIGKMGSALASGIARGKGAKLILCGRRYGEAKRIARKIGASAAKDATEAVRKANIIILAVKPKDIEALLFEIKHGLDGKLLVSIAAGIPIPYIRKRVPKSCRISVAMPNLAVENGKGAVMFFAKSRQDAVIVRKLLAPAGAVILAKREEDIDFAMLTGSGMAFFLAAIEGMAKAGERHGLSYAKALELSAKAAEGAGALVIGKKIRPLELERMVATKKGITLHGLKELRKAKVQSIFHNAAYAVIKEAKRRRERNS